MEKFQIQIPVILPHVPDEKDTCVHLLIQELEGRPGIQKVHISEEREEGIPLLCFHYDPDILSFEQVKALAKYAGASLTEKFGHLLAEVSGIRHVQHSRNVEHILKHTKGILMVSVSATGFVRIEFETDKIRIDQIFDILRKNDLKVVDPLLSSESYLAEKERTDKHDTKKAVSEKTSVHDGHKHDHGHDGHQHNQDDHHHHDHEHGGFLGENTELIFSVICGAFLAGGFGLSFAINLPSWVITSLYIAAYFFGGYYTAKEAVQAIAHKNFEIDFLMLVAAIGAAILGEWAEGALLLFLFSMGHALEHYAMGKAQKSIAALSDLAPKTALVKREEGTIEVPIGELKEKEVVVVRPNTKIPADGIVRNGLSSVNQAPITGESIPVEKTPASGNSIDPANRVFAGTINGASVLEIEVTKAAADSTLSRLVKMVNEAQTQKSPTQLFTDRFEKYFVPSVLMLVFLLHFAFLFVDEVFSASFYRAMSVLVAASPCALAISTPSAVLSAVARAARQGVLIKGGRPLEDLGNIMAIAFDKTGTLTEGKPRLTSVIALNGRSEQDVLLIAVAAEALSDHPLAKAIVKDGTLRLGNTSVPAASGLQSESGKGVKASVEGKDVYIGNLAMFKLQDSEEDQIKKEVRRLEENGNTTMIVKYGDVYIGIIGVMDTPRAEAKTTLEKLKTIGMRRMIMLTGDNQRVADAVAKEIGLTDAYGNLLPEQKVESVKKLKAEEQKVAMVGDGVNDAPAMANSTVGIAMGAAGSDVALETADIALMADKLENLPFAIGLSRKSRRIIRQNLIISLGMVAVLIPLTISGIATIGPAVLLHEGSTLIVVFNALRLLGYKSK